MMARLTELEKKSAVFQAGGGMVFWNKPLADIPEGWQEVVDWRGRMPVGFDENDPDFNVMGKMSGYKSKTLSESEMPAHNHSITLSQRNGENDANVPFAAFSNSGSGAQSQNVTAVTTSKGSGQAFSILNPYRVVLFIEYIG